jgi:hypothetical protein
VDLRFIAHGDCGSWVVDTVTGDLYGQIVAGCPESGVAYIFPAKHIQRDIWRVSGSCSLPSKTFQQLRQDNRLTFPSESLDLDHSERSQSLEIEVGESSVEKTSPPGVNPEAWLDSLRKPPSFESLNTTPRVDTRGTSTAHPSLRYSDIWSTQSNHHRRSTYHRGQLHRHESALHSPLITKGERFL